MKNRNKISHWLWLSVLIILVLGGTKCLAQSDKWEWQNPLPTGNAFNEVYFSDNQTGWAVGWIGTIRKTTNGGASWHKQNSGTQAHLFSVFFIDNQTGWAAGLSGTILKTTNGGQNWIAKNSGTNTLFYSIRFVSSQTGWAVGTSPGSNLKTTDGGETWQIQSNSAVPFNSCHPINSELAWVVGNNGQIQKTSDGGQSWENQTSGTSRRLNSVQFINLQKGWAVGDSGTILRTTNGGQTWHKQMVGTSSTLGSVYFTDSLKGWAVGQYGKILKTTDGGIDWIDQSISNDWLNSIHFNNDQNGWIVGALGKILSTTDCGTTWQPQSYGITGFLTSVHFIDNQVGWAVGTGGIVLKTTNVGKNWILQTSGNYPVLLDVHFFNPTNGLAVGLNGTIIQTSNGGLDWEPQNSPTTSTLNSVFFVSSQTGWAVGNSGTMLKTTNGGTSWQTQTTGISQNLLSVHFSNIQKGWCVGASGTILVTNNGGQNWVSQNSGTSNELKSIFFTNNQTGWAVGDYGTIVKTTNGGISWQTQNSGTSTRLKSIHFPSQLVGWAVGEEGKILYTSNGGNNWQNQAVDVSFNLNGAFFISPNLGWMVGDFGTIIRFYNGPENDPPGYLLSGRLFEKTDSDCSNSTVGIPYGVVKAEPGSHYTIADQTGNFQLKVPLANAVSTVTLSPVSFYNEGFQSTLACPPSGQIPVLVGTQPDTLSGNNFGFEIAACHHLDVQLSSNRRRRCFVNTTSISFFNQGSLTAPQAYILVEFPHWVRPISASRPYLVLNDSIWRFEMGDVAPGSWGAFTIKDSVICGNLDILGLSQCTRATIFPAPDCPPSGNWSGAAVSVSGKCENGLVKLGIYNRTNVSMPDSVDYWVYMDSIQVRVGRVKLAAGDSLKMSVLPAGMGVYLSVNQVANHPNQQFVSTAVEGCGIAPMLIANAVSTHLPVSQLPNSKTQCLPIMGSYDPNDKQVFPKGFTNQNTIAPGTRLEYLIRFQNTGNDTAFTVFVIDTLDSNLNVETFEMGAASHPFRLRLQTTQSGKTLLHWQFNNIRLPDSTTNEAASNGFIQFRISPKSGLALGSTIRNFAEIYFDFNPPIRTNPTLSTYNVLVFQNPNLNNNVQIVNSREKELENLGIKLYPNPVTQNRLTVSFTETGSITLFDAKGQAIYTQSQLIGTEAIPLSLQPGFYYATLRTVKGSQCVKVVVE